MSKDLVQGETRPKYLVEIMLREVLRKPSNQPIVIALVVMLVAAAAFSAYWTLRPDDAAIAAGSQMFVDSKTGNAFSHTLKIGESVPVEAPSGGMTGYPGTACYWNRDGSIRSKPFWAITNETLGKSGPTFCPDCGRLLVPHAPIPSPGDKAPPLESEYTPPKLPPK